MNALGHAELSITQDNVSLIFEKSQEYDRDARYYDDIFDETGDRLRAQGFATKTDIAVVTFWKGINLSTRWVRDFLRLDPADVRQKTERAFRAYPTDADRQRLVALQGLPGFKSWGGRKGGAIPSTLLCCWDPQNYAVTDVRAREGLDILGFPVAELIEYWSVVRILRNAVRKRHSSFTARDVDKALFKIAGDKKRL